MIAMQYSFTLPADYDMDIIRQRIARLGHHMDGFPGLCLKAYLYADTLDPEHPARANRYAPFYLWHDVDGMNRFLEGAGFAALVESFGRPQVRTWSVWAQSVQATAASARWACLEEESIAEFIPLAQWKATELARTEAASEQAGTCVTACGYAPKEWSDFQLRLLHEAPDHFAPGVQYFRVGHVSLAADHDLTARPSPGLIRYSKSACAN
jgi:hypothetical protein